MNAFDSQEKLNSVGKAYKTNEAWNAALTRNQKRKESLTGKSIEELADLEPQTQSRPWAVGRAQFVVVAMNPAAHLGGSNVFKGRDGTRYEILTANTREEAERVANGMKFVLLEVVPRWSFPASADRHIPKPQPRLITLLQHVRPRDRRRFTVS